MVRVWRSCGNIAAAAAALLVSTNPALASMTLAATTLSPAWLFALAILAPMLLLLLGTLAWLASDLLQRSKDWPG